MERIKKYLLMCWLILISGSAFAAVQNDLVLENQTITAVQVLEYYAYDSITAGPSYVMKSGSDVTLRSSGSITLAPGFSAELGSKLLVEIVSEPPNIAPVADPVAVNTDEDVSIIVPLSASDEDVDDVFTYLIVSNPAHGTLSGTHPNVTYTPAADFNGSDSFTYKVNDARSDSNTATVSVTVNPINDAPQIADNSFSTNEDIFATAPLSASDIDADTLTYIIVSSPAHGTLSGSYPNMIYTPASNFNGSDSFTYKVNDGLIDSNVSTISITVISINDVPQAFNDTLSINEDTPATAPVSGSDTEASPLTYTIVSNPAHGTLSGVYPSMIYTPASNFNGSDSFTYKVNDGVDNSNTATISITVNPVNDTPVAANDTFLIDEDDSAIVPLIASDIDADPLTCVIVANPVNGVLSGAYPNFVYTPAVDFNGADSFSYKVNDGNADSNTATISITVNSINDAPVSTDNASSTDEDMAVAIALETSDTETDPLTYVIVSNPANGVLSGTAPNLTYTPAADFSGADSFTYKVNDGNADSNISTVSITVNPINDAPVTTNGTFSIDEDGSEIVLFAASDVDADPLTYTIVSSPANGILSGSYPNFVYTPAADFNGADSFTYKVNDGTLDSNVSTISIAVNSINDAPVSTDDASSTDEDVAVAIVLGISDTETDPLTYVIVSNPANGVLSGTAPNLTYTPAADFNGADSFTYKVNDGNADSNIATISITVNPINDAPIAIDDAFSINEDNELDVPLSGVLVNDTDAEGSPLTAVIVYPTLNGTISFETDGSFVFIPDADFNGADSFTYKVNDGALDSNIATVSITVNPINDAPVSADQSLSQAEDVPLVITLAGTDVDADPLTFNILTSPVHGALSGTGSNLTYTPAENYVGSDSFTFSVNDGAIDSLIRTITLDVTAVNDAPEANNDNFIMHMNTVLIKTIPGVLINDADIENDTITASLVSTVSNGVLVLNADGSFTYTPTTDFAGVDSFTYVVNDGNLDSTVATAAIDISVVPIAYEQSITTPEDTDKPITLVGGDSFDNPVTYTIITNPSNGTLSGTLPDLTYSPNAEYFGTDSFTFKVNNGAEDSAPATVNLSITPVNDQPVPTKDNIVSNEDTSLTTLNLLLNDTDVEGDTLSVASFTQPVNGVVVHNGDGIFTYTPAENFNGSDSFTYVVNDGTIDSMPATVNILVNAVNDIPVALAQTVSTPANTALPIILTGSDVEGDAFTFELVSDVQNGTLTGTLPNLTYTPTPGVFGDDSFSFRVKEGSNYSAAVTVGIRVKTPVPTITFTGSSTNIKPGDSKTLSWTTEYTDLGVSITPGVGAVASSGNHDVSPVITTTYTLTANGEGGSFTKTFTVTVDAVAPTVDMFEPAVDGQVNLEDLQMGLVATFTDNLGVLNVKLYQVDGETDIDVSELATITGNTISFDISGLENGTYTFKLVISDEAGNETTQIFTFTVDKILPVSSVTAGSGSFSAPFTVDLTCSEPATIFYSTDGSPPFEGGANTISGTTPIMGININNSMNLQFFAKDTFGNIEAVVQSVVYLLGAIPDAVADLAGIYNSPDIDLSWTASAGAAEYRVYRTLNQVDHDILVQSTQGGYAPPVKLRYSTVPSGTTFIDTNVMPGMTYYYGITQVDSNGVEGVIGQIVSVQTPETVVAIDKDEAVARALAWLESKQDKIGFWGKKEIRSLTTSQVLNAYKLAGKNDLNTHYALFYLRGHSVDNNDFLARKILTLNSFGQNVDIHINKLVSKGYFTSAGTYLRGWGINEFYLYDGVSSILGLSALDKYKGTLASESKLKNYHYIKTNTYMQSNEVGTFGWIAGADKSLYVSSLVYGVLDTVFPSSAPVFDSTWIALTQIADGSLGTGVIDTAAVLLWIDSLTQIQKDDAIAYLISQQNLDGSWGDDPYLTGLCLEALLK